MLRVFCITMLVVYVLSSPILLPLLPPLPPLVEGAVLLLMCAWVVSSQLT